MNWNRVQFVLPVVLFIENKADKIPIGIHMQSVTEKESLFNVFIPNIDPNIKINYKNCTFKLISNCIQVKYNFVPYFRELVESKEKYGK